MRELIIRGTTEFFLQNGIRNISVHKLVASLGISTKTFYKFFKNKKELLEEVLIKYYANQLNFSFEKNEYKNAVHFLVNLYQKVLFFDSSVNKEFFNDLEQYYPTLEETVKSRVVSEYRNQYQSLIHKGIEEGLFIKNIHPAIFMKSMSVLYYSVVKTERFERYKIESQYLFLNSLGVLIRGICTLEGIKEFEKYFSRD